MVHDGGTVLDAAKETTTLYTRLHEGTDASGPVIGAGVLTLGVADLIAMLQTVRVLNAKSKSDSAAAVARFGRFFLGQLWNSYGIHASKTN